MSDRFLICADGVEMGNEMLGHGGFGIVMPAILTSTQTKVAVKIFRIYDWKNLYAEVKKEEDLMRTVRHPNIIKYIGYNENEIEREFWIIMELMDGTLRSFGHGFSVLRKYDIAVQCWSALSYLHDKVHIWHKDINPDNILLKKLPGGKILTKLSDFGLSAVKAIKTSEPSRGSGTVRYKAPEVYADGTRSEKSDVFSMGVTLTELFTGKQFWPQKLTAQYQLGKAYEQATAPDSESISAIDIAGHDEDTVLSTCLAGVIPCLKAATTIQRKLRPTAAEALKILTATDSGYWEMVIEDFEVELHKLGGKGSAREQLLNLRRSPEPDNSFCKFIALKCGIGETEIMQAGTLFSLLQEYVFPYVVILSIYDELPADMPIINMCILEEIWISKRALTSVVVLPSTLKKVTILPAKDLREDVLSLLARLCPNLHGFCIWGKVVKSKDVFENFCASCPALKNIHLLNILNNGGWLSECDSFWKLPLVHLRLILHGNETTDKSILPMIAKNFKNLEILTFQRNGTLLDNEVSPLSELKKLRVLHLRSEKLVTLSSGLATIVKAGNVRDLLLVNIFVGNEFFADCPTFFSTVIEFEALCDELPAEQAVEIVRSLQNFGISKYVYVRIGESMFDDEDFQEDFATFVCNEIYAAAGPTTKLSDFKITYMNDDLFHITYRRTTSN